MRRVSDGSGPVTIQELYSELEQAFEWRDIELRPMMIGVCGVIHRQDDFEPFSDNLRESIIQ